MEFLFVFIGRENCAIMKLVGKLSNSRVCCRIIKNYPTAGYAELSERRCGRTARLQMGACFSSCDHDGSLSLSGQQRQLPQKKRRSAKSRVG